MFIIMKFTFANEVSHLNGYHLYRACPRSESLHVPIVLIVLVTMSTA